MSICVMEMTNLLEAHEKNTHLKNETMTAIITKITSNLLVCFLFKIPIEPFV